MHLRQLQQLRWDDWLRWIVLGGAVGLFGWMVAQAYRPGQGFTSLLLLGDQRANTYLPELRDRTVYLHPDSYGYDAANYAQIALRPTLKDPALWTAVDNPPYRARRILLSWLAWLFGGGDATAVLNAYALFNVIAWLALAVLLWRWIPPTSWDHVVRWLGIMFSHGLCFSVRGSVTDGVSVLLIAIAVVLVEAGRRWGGAILLGLTGLVRETNVLAATSLFPLSRQTSVWRTTMGFLTLVLLPLSVWMFALHGMVGSGGETGAGNLTWPWSAYGREWREAWTHFQSHGTLVERTASGCVTLALTVQWVVIVFRPQWMSAWWRVGASYALLMIFLGDSVWEGVPGAAGRVLLPLTVAFNLLLPRGARWWALLVLGNLSVIPSALTSTVGLRDVIRTTGPCELRCDPHGRRFWAELDPSWHALEASTWGRNRWRWAGSSAGVALDNPHSEPVRATLRYTLGARQSQRVEVQLDGEPLWSGEAGPKLLSVEVADVMIPTGRSRLDFVSGAAAQTAGPTDHRPIVFNLRELEIELHERVP